MTPADAEQRLTGTASSEAKLVARLRAGDEQAFAELIDSYHGTMLAVARNYVNTRAVAEEVVQEAWLGVIKGLDRFQGRSSLKTWILRILVNTAMTRGGQEARSIPFSSLAREDEAEPAVEPDRFRRPDGAFPGHWAAYPANWGALPEDRVFGRETLGVMQEAIEALPTPQRVVITLRDVQGCSPEEVCDALDVSDGNQRVLLHRARSRVRAALERHFDG
ncbi:MAG TPA: RNA polymerase sigma factor [Thermoleophilaceae bacterium]